MNASAYARFNYLNDSLFACVNNVSKTTLGHLDEAIVAQTCKNEALAMTEFLNPTGPEFRKILMESREGKERFRITRQKTAEELEYMRAMVDKANYKATQHAQHVKMQ